MHGWHQPVPGKRGPPVIGVPSTKEKRCRPPVLPVTWPPTWVDARPRRIARTFNIDYAASAPALESVTAHVQQLRTVLCEVSSRCRIRLAGLYLPPTRRRLARTSPQFVGARPDDVVVFTRQHDRALNLLAAGAREVLFLDVEHHANLLPLAARMRIESSERRNAAAGDSARR